MPTPPCDGLAAYSGAKRVCVCCRNFSTLTHWWDDHPEAKSLDQLCARTSVKCPVPTLQLTDAHGVSSNLLRYPTCVKPCAPFITASSAVGVFRRTFVVTLVWYSVMSSIAWLYCCQRLFLMIPYSPVPGKQSKQVAPNTFLNFLSSPLHQSACPNFTLKYTTYCSHIDRVIHTVLTRPWNLS